MKMGIITLLIVIGIFPLTVANILNTSQTQINVQAPAPTPDAEQIAYGIEVYRSQYCGMCHTLTVASTGGTFGPSHDGIGTIAEERIQAEAYTGKATTAEDYLRESIVEPAIFRVPEFSLSNHQMPPYSHLPAEDIEAMVYLLINQVD